jgi:hypothetical protein
MTDARVPILYLAPWVDDGGSDKDTVDWFRCIDRARFRPSLITTQPSANRRLGDVVSYADEIWALPDLMPGAQFAEFIIDFIVSREVAIVHIMDSRIGFDVLPDIHSLSRRPRIVVQLHMEEPARDGYTRYVTTRFGTLVDAFSVSSEHLAADVAGYGVSRDRIEVIPSGEDAPGLRQMGERHGELYERLCLLERVPAADRGPYADISQRMLFVSRPSRGKPLVSIVTPCFNHGHWLRECVAAVREQTYPNLEMVVCDDGSTERETLDYLAQLEQDAEVRVVRLAENSGPSTARNRAVAESRGRYVLPVDADNVLLPDAVDRLVAHIQGSGAHVGYVYQNLQFFGNREDYLEAPVFNAWQLTRGNFIDTCALIDREVFERGFRYPDEVRFGHEDWDFVLSLAEHGIFGEPLRAKTLRFRKHGFSRSDRIDWANPNEDLHAGPPTLVSTSQQARGDNPAVRLKARWSPSLAVVALTPLTGDSTSWARLLTSIRAQHFRDFELYAAIDREPAADEHRPPVRVLPSRLAIRPAECVAYALEVSGARNVVVSCGDGAEVLGDPGSLERLTRLLEDEGAGARMLCFADAGPGHHPFAPITAENPAVTAHTVAWSRRHATLEEPPSFDAADPVGGLGRWCQLQRIPTQWRHMSVAPSPGIRSGGVRFVPLSRPPLPRAESAGRRAQLQALPILPGATAPIPRWAAYPTWLPAATAPLVRHRRLDRDEWLVNPHLGSPAGFFAEHYLGVTHLRSLEGTSRLVRDPISGYAALPRGGEPDADDMARSLGYVEQSPLPMLERLLLARHSASGLPVLVCGDDDPIMSAVDGASITELGWIDRMPVNPPSAPGAVESMSWLRGLVRTVDPAARRHRVSIGDGPESGAPNWELGALLDRDPGDGIAAWVDADGRLHTAAYAPTRYPFDTRRSLSWAIAPATWRGFGRARPRAQAVARRSLDIARYVRTRPGLANAVALAGPADAWFLAEEGPERIPIYSSIHPVTADQLVTRDPSEARDLGYGSVRLIGYALALAPATGTLARPRMAVGWGSRFGESLTRSEDPVRQVPHE